MFKSPREYSESALSALGLQRHRSASEYILPAIGLVGVGVLIGVSLGLLLAPKPGIELRGDIGRGVRRVGGKLRRRRDSLDVQDQGAVGDVVDTDAQGASQ